jgi:hypothetical protein
MESWSISRRVATGQDYNMHDAAVGSGNGCQKQSAPGESQGLMEGSR